MSNFELDGIDIPLVLQVLLPEELGNAVFWFLNLMSDSYPFLPMILAWPPNPLSPLYLYQTQSPDSYQCSVVRSLPEMWGAALLNPSVWVHAATEIGMGDKRAKTRAWGLENLNICQK